MLIVEVYCFVCGVVEKDVETVEAFVRLVH